MKIKKSIGPIKTNERSLIVPRGQLSTAIRMGPDQLTPSSVSWTVGDLNLHPGRGLSGELGPSLIHEPTPLLGALALYADLEFDSLIGVFLELGECPSDNIDGFLRSQRVVQVANTYHPKQDDSHLGPGLEHRERSECFP
jgi:hypothetical protein